MTRAQLALESGVSPHTIQRHEAGRGGWPHDTTVVLLAQALRCDWRALCGPDGLPHRQTLRQQLADTAERLPGGRGRAGDDRGRARRRDRAAGVGSPLTRTGGAAPQRPALDRGKESSSMPRTLDACRDDLVNRKLKVSIVLLTHAMDDLDSLVAALGARDENGEILPPDRMRFAEIRDQIGDVLDNGLLALAELEEARNIDLHVDPWIES
jgi:hypothetical protein